jgi:His/Glu/Gln/Arg/opine family amino acid ABC transporter permease subunit
MPIFAQGARWTLILSITSFFAALPPALMLAVARSSRLLRVPAAAWVELLRGTPLLVQVFFIYFVLPGFGLSLGDFTTAVVALSLNSAAYISEIFRAALDSIDAGQSEAAAALGMGRLQVLRYVLIPQAIRRVVPPLTNEAISLIKESSLVSVMGMTELTRTGQELASRYADPLSIWPGVALCYFVLTFPLARMSSALEKRFAVGRRLARESS